MVFIETVPDDAAEGETAALYAEDVEAMGYVANYTRAFSRRPDVMRAWEQLNLAIRGNMDRRLYELATLAAATRLRSSYCSLAHGSVLATKFYGSAEVAAIARDHHSAALSGVDMGVMDFAAMVAGHADQITQGDVDRLRDLGLSDTQIFDVAAAAAARSFFAKVLDAVGAEPDSAYRDLDLEMRDTLTVGRPIEG